MPSHKNFQASTKALKYNIGLVGTRSGRLISKGEHYVGSIYKNQFDFLIDMLTKERPNTKARFRIPAYNLMEVRFKKFGIAIVIESHTELTFKEHEFKLSFHYFNIGKQYKYPQYVKTCLDINSFRRFFEDYS